MKANDSKIRHTCGEFGGMTAAGEPCAANATATGMCAHHRKLQVRLHPDKLKNAFLVAFAELGCVSFAARATRIDRKNHYVWLKNDPEYAEAFSAADEIATDYLEMEARRRAIRGIHEPVYQNGRQVGSITRYSDSLLTLLLKGRRRNVYGDKTDVNHSGEIKGGVLMIPTPVSAEEWAAVAERQQSGLLSQAKELAEQHTVAQGNGNGAKPGVNGNGNGNGKH